MVKRKRYSCPTCGETFSYVVEAPREKETKLIPRFTKKARKKKRCCNCKIILPPGLSRLHVSVIKSNRARFSVYLCKGYTRKHRDIKLRGYAEYYDWVTEDEDCKSSESPSETKTDANSNPQ